MRILTARLVLVLAGLWSRGPALAEPFTVVVLPDTQNYVDFTKQKSAGFALDGSEVYLEHMQHIASKGVANGGDVVFVAAVGDVWQHLSRDDDPEHERRGILSIGAGPTALITPDQTLNFEIPLAVRGYRLLAAAGIPFGVPPGNHDYDAWWTAPVAGTVPSDADAATLAAVPQENRQIHIGGLEAFKRAFGSDSEFFRGKSWYVSALEGGTSSAQIFEAGGYRFLHLAFEMQAGDQVLEWAERVLDEHPGLPTIVSTHDYLNPRGERAPSSMDLARVDPGYNNDAETIWRKFVSRNDQIFMVLCGHQPGQALRVDRNESGHAVYQMLADYQDRGQASIDAGQAN
ncbi:MAG TPA: serine/threonine protein phosphatase, partial [Gammaproteobacteria bacterium]